MFRSKERTAPPPAAEPLPPDRGRPPQDMAVQPPAAAAAPTAPAPQAPRLPQAAPAAQAAPSAAAKPTTPKLLIVGHDISLAGEITACDRLVVEGSVKVTLNQTRAIEITETGRFLDGKAEVEEAVISGVYEGELTVRGRLLIRSTGKVRGDVRYGELEIERGGCLAGTIEVHAPVAKPSAPMAAAAPARPAEAPPAATGTPVAAKLNGESPAPPAG